MLENHSNYCRMELPPSSFKNPFIFKIGLIPITTTHHLTPGPFLHISRLFFSALTVIRFTRSSHYQIKRAHICSIRHDFCSSFLLPIFVFVRTKERCGRARSRARIERMWWGVWCATWRSEILSRKCTTCRSQ